MARGFQPLDGLLGRLLKNPRLVATGSQVARLRAAWSEVVGAPIAVHTQASHVQGRALVVHVDDAGWLTELNFRRAELLARIHAWAGEPWPAELRLVLHPLAPTPTLTPTPLPPPPPSRERLQEAAAVAAAVEDEALRVVITRALAAQRGEGSGPAL